MKKFNCKKCNGDEFIYDSKNNSGIPCTCLRLKAYMRHIANDGYGITFEEKQLDNFCTENRHPTIIAAKSQVVRYVTDIDSNAHKVDHSLLLLGKSYQGQKTGIGGGKTHLAIAAANELMYEHGIGVRFIVYRSFMSNVKQLVGQNSNELSKLLYSLKTAPVLLIDDLFKGKVSEFEISLMYDIINDRYLSKKPVIITSELSMFHLIDIDEATATRLVEMATGKNIIEIGVDGNDVQNGQVINHRLL